VGVVAVSVAVISSLLGAQVADEGGRDRRPFALLSLHEGEEDGVEKKRDIRPFVGTSWRNNT